MSGEWFRIKNTLVPKTSKNQANDNVKKTKTANSDWTKYNKT